MLAQGQVGSPATTASLPPGSQPATRFGNMGDGIVSELHGRYYEQSYRGAGFSGGTAGVIATALSTGLATAYTGGFVLYNPYGNTKNIVLQKVGVGVVLAQTNAAVLGIMTGQSNVALAGTLTAMTTQSNLVGSNSAPTALLYSSATITLPVAPVLRNIIGAVATGALTVGTTTLGGTTDFEGSIILAPGAFACLYSSAAGTASSLAATVQWEEVPL